MHIYTYSYARGIGCRAFVCMRVAIEKQLVAAYGVVFQDGARELHFLREKFALLQRANALKLPSRVAYLGEQRKVKKSCFVISISCQGDFSCALSILDFFSRVQ